MIIKYFSDYLKENYKKDEKSTIELLSFWLKEKIENPPKCLEDKVIQREIYIAKNKNTPKTNEFFLIGKSDSGRILINALFNFAQSFEQQDFARTIHNSKISDINKC